ncbi:MAG: cellulase family glycosylhydrolase, partial [Ruminiclostridium sp.]|nr:cellulase family glycosylhydrolase [Ruminiclostridium sp.]
MKFLKKAVSWLLIVAMIFTVNIPAFAADITLPDNEAIRFVDKLGAAWNLGNAFDATGCTWLTNELDYESGWCGAKTTEKLITTLAEAGFKTIRIPVSWHDHVDSNNTISTAWINRVQEVVDWCIDAGMYVILNVHHDVEVGYYFPDSANYTTSEKFMKDVWKQISEKFKNYDNRLIFETINEPRLKGNTNYEWWFNINYPPTEILDSVDCINRLNQAALDTIRAAGGNNADRYVLIPGYDTSVDGLTVSGFEMPDDSAKNRLIANFHLYTMDESRYKSEIDRVYEKFVKNGIPAILSEYNLDPGDKQCYDDNSADYLGKFVAYARERGITCAIWDNNADEYKLINRADSAWVHKDIALSVIENGTREILVEAPVVSVSTGDGTAKLTWNAVKNAASYRVYRAESASGAKTLIGTPTATSYTDTSVTAGNTYYYFVTAYDSANAVESEYSSAVSVTVLNDAKIADFVERLYTKLLGRASDANGKAKWIEKLKNGSTAADVAVNFVISDEIEQQKLSNETFVKRMYQTMLDRTPADSEIANWASYLDAGCTYAFVFRG